MTGVGFIVSICMSQPFLRVSVWVFSSFPMCRSQLVFRFLSEGIAPCLAVYSVPLWEKGKSGASCVANLVMF